MIAKDNGLVRWTVVSVLLWLLREIRDVKDDLQSLAKLCIVLGCCVWNGWVVDETVHVFSLVDSIILQWGILQRTGSFWNLVRCSILSL